MKFKNRTFVPFLGGRFQINNIYFQFDVHYFLYQYAGIIKKIKLSAGTLKITLKKGTVSRFIGPKDSSDRGQWRPINRQKTFFYHLRRNKYFPSYDSNKVLCLKTLQSDKFNKSEYEIFLYKPWPI